MARKGSSLIIALLMLAVISTASFGIARLAMVEMATSATEAINTKAYYLAEGGIEENLLRWRYDHSAVIGPDSTENSKVWERVGWENGSTDINFEPAVADGDFKADIVTFNKNYIASTIYNKVSQSVGWTDPNVSTVDQLASAFDSASFDEDKYLNNNGIDRSDLKVTKDNKITFGFSDITTNMDIVWRWQKIAVGSSSTNKAWADRGTTSQFGVEARLYSKGVGGDTLLAKNVFSPDTNKISKSDSCGIKQSCEIINIKAQMHQSAASSPLGEIYLTLTPIGADIVVGAFGYDTSGAAANYIDSITHLESVGVTGGRYKGLQVKLDKNSGRILGLYDYVLFEGRNE